MLATEDVARQSGIEIGQLRPEDAEPTAEGIVESRVDLRASNLSVDRLQDFLERLDKAPGVVVVRRLKIAKQQITNKPSVAGSGT